MRMQDAMGQYTLNAVDFLFRAASRVPEDKLTWQPMEARSILDQLQECAQSPLWYSRYLDPTFDPQLGSLAEMIAARQQWDTVAKCEEVLRANTGPLIERIRNVPDEDLQNEHTMPWGKVMTTFDLISAHYWNLTYHTGQIYYVQTLYGDKEM